MIKSEKDYTAIVKKSEELHSIPENIENPEAKWYVELNQLSDLIQEKHHPIQPPTLSESIKLQLQEQGFRLE